MEPRKIPSHNKTVAVLTPEQDKALEIARVGFMSACPFYSHYFYSECIEVPTMDVETAATDGRHVFINPEYVSALKPSERVFVYAHEIDHIINQDPQRMRTYATEGFVRGVEFDEEQYQRAMDYRINAGLMEMGVGLMNPSWCFDKRIDGDMLAEDAYKVIYQKRPPGPDGNGPGGGGTGGINPGGRAGAQGKVPKGAAPDKKAGQNNGGFDSVLPPPVDPVTGKEDIPDEMEFREAVARAAAAAKAMGNLPDYLSRRVDEILAPQVDWRDHVRMIMTGIFGARGETWAKLDRRSAALYGLAIDMDPNPFCLKPGRKGYGADTVVVCRDTSGSISAKEESAYMGEIGGILADVRPRRVILMDCDARVQRVQELASLEEAGDEKVRETLGHGGTSFIPPFVWCEENHVKPEAFIYLTDMMGPFPSDPGYPVVWCATTDAVAPFGETIRLKV